MNRIQQLISMRCQLSNVFKQCVKLLSITILFISSVDAAVWLFDPTITLSQGYSDNYRLSSDSSDEDDVSTTRLSGELALKGKSERLNVKALVRLDVTKYGGDDDDLSDRNNQLASLSSNYKVSERNTFTLKSKMRRDSILRTEEIIASPGDTDDEVALEPDQDIDANLVRNNIRRTRFSINPGWRYRVSEKTSIGINYRYRDLSFSGEGNTGLVESDRQTIGLSVNRIMSEKDRLTASISESYFRPDNVGEDRDVDTIEARLKWTRDFSETYQMDFSIGGRDSDFDNAPKSSDSGVVANIGATKRAGLTTYRVNVERRVNPSASGNQVEVDELSLNVNRKITETLSFNFNGRFFDTETTGDNNSASDREYLTLSPSLNWRFSPSWVAGVSYQFIDEDRDNGGDADSNNAFFRISYSPPRQF